MKDDSTFEVSDLMQQFVNEAFEIAGKWLESSEAFSFLYWLENGEKKFAAIAHEDNGVDVLDQIRSWSHGLSPGVPLFVRIDRAAVAKDGRSVDAVIAHGAERLQPQGFMLMHALARDKVTGRLHLDGNIEFMTLFDNDMFC